jgi:peptide/nickel transport system ATP-binding protein
MALLTLENLTVEFATRRGILRALDGISLSIEAGEVLGLVGESGAGKSLTGVAVIGLLEPPGRIAGASTTCPMRRCGGSAAGRSARSSRTR